MLRARRQGVSPGCGCPGFAPLSAFSNVRRITTLFVGYRHLNRQQKINDLRRFASGALCPPRAPPECFSWFYFGFILFLPCSRVLENLARLPPFFASAGFARRCWRNANPPKKESSKSPLLINTRPYKWRAIFFVEWIECTTFVRAPLTQLTSVARISPEPADVGRLQEIRLFFDICKCRSTNSPILWIVSGYYIALNLGFRGVCRCI